MSIIATAAAAGAIGGATVILTKQAIVDYRSAAVALAALGLLLKFKLREPYIVLLGAVAGLALHGL
jgi:chromate transporter